MTNHMQNQDNANHTPKSEGEKKISSKKTLDTFFPTTWLITLMVGIVLVFNIIVGLKVFSLQKEKAVVEMLRDRYESYGKIIRDIEIKQDLLRTLTAEVPLLELRKENALKSVNDSETILKKNKSTLDIVLAEHNEVGEQLNAMRKTIAELSNDKQSLQREKDKLDMIVIELRIDQERTEQELTKSRLDMRTIREEIHATEVQLKEQQQRVLEVAAANSSFEEMRNQLLDFIQKMNETQSSASQKIKSLDEALGGITEQNEQLTLQTSKLTEETKNITQSNSTIRSEIDLFQQHTKGYQAEVEKVAFTTGNMKSTVETINEVAGDLRSSEVIFGESLTTINKNLLQIQTTGGELAQIQKDFNTEILELKTQRENIGVYLRDFTNLSNIKRQSESLQIVLDELEILSSKLSERVAALQNDFDVKLNGMKLSFGTLEQDFKKLSLKLDSLGNTLERVAAETSELNLDNQQD